MPLLIDCYNLLHAPMPPSLAGLEEDGLCRRLASSPWSGTGITIVCDGVVKPGTPAFSPVPQAQLVYSGPGRSADDVIIELIDADNSPRRLYVVTDDREIQKAARRRRCQVLSTGSFIRALAAARPAGGAATPSNRSRAALSPTQVDHWLEQFGIDPNVPPDEAVALPPQQIEEKARQIEEQRADASSGAPAPDAESEAIQHDEVARWLAEFGIAPDEPIDPREKEWWEGG